jgi:hypothetical protein
MTEKGQHPKHCRAIRNGRSRYREQPFENLAAKQSTVCHPITIRYRNQNGLFVERIASSDALYYDCEHTALVTLRVQDILRGRHVERTITPSTWAVLSWLR